MDLFNRVAANTGQRAVCLPEGKASRLSEARENLTSHCDRMPACAAVKPEFQIKIAALPNSPGVYSFKDKEGAVLYVGKARNLRLRVNSYFPDGKHSSVKTRAMLSRVEDLEVFVTSNEKEALILESNLIKKHRPRYNVVLRDDKRYFSLRIDPREEFPRITLVRQVKKDGALYFGPFSSASALRETLRAVNQMFPLRQCRSRTFRRRQRPCLNFQMGRCLGPCAGRISAEEYAKIVDQAVLFLKGRNTQLQKTLHREMKEAAQALEFEKAARYRDRLKAIEATLEKQGVTSTDFRNRDVIGVYGDNEILVLEILFIRGGRLLGGRNFEFRSLPGDETELLRSFIQQYYAEGRDIPEELLLSGKVAEAQLLMEWLTELKGKKVNIRVPRRGRGRHLVAMAVHNAANHFLARKSPATETAAAHHGLAKLLKTTRKIQYLECVDISNFQGQFAVGSVVAFKNGKPYKAGYRRYRIRSVAAVNDAAMLAEVVRRRFKDLKEADTLPDLLVVDGGKSQLNSALAVLRELGLVERLPLLALAKGAAAGRQQGGPAADRVYLVNRRNPVSLEKEAALAALLARLRDEAHRFAIEYYQKRHRKESLASRLDSIPGVGARRRQKLVRHFGSMEKIAQASAAELAEVPGISQKLARTIRTALAEQKNIRP